MSIQKCRFGTLPDGRPVHRFDLKNYQGMTAGITDYGAVVVSLSAPDRKGRYADIVLGYDTLEDYLKDRYYFGCVVGRCANRIAEAQFSLDGKTWPLSANHGRHQLHGGADGFNRRVWKAEPELTEEGAALRLRYQSAHMEEGYPGNLSVTVTYTLTHNNALKISYEAQCDRMTVVNLTHHSYFNLKGVRAKDGVVEDCLDHELRIDADAYLPTDGDLVPTGERRKVGGTAMDFRRMKRIRDMMDFGDDQVRLAGGFDHTWVLNASEITDGIPRLAATLFEPESGRVMEVFTTQPGMQFYSGNSLDDSIAGKDGMRYLRHGGLCLETQGFPNAPNQPDFPSVVLNPGETYRHETVYRFTAQI